MLGYEKMLDETGREMHGSWGNMIDAEEAFERMGADVMRWQFCAQPPDRNLLFGFGPAHEIKRKLLTLWNSVRFLVDYGRSRTSGRRGATCRRAARAEAAGPVADRPDARARPGRDRRVRGVPTVDVIRAFESFVDDLSNWYIRRSRRRFWESDPVALRVLWLSLVQSLRVVAPVMPFLTEHLWQIARARRGRGAAGVGAPRGLAGRAGA